MTADNPLKPRPSSGWYQITIRGEVSVDRESWFGDMTIQSTGSGDTCLSGWLPDQPALHGLLAQVRDLGLVLVELRLAQPQS